MLQYYVKYDIIFIVADEFSTQTETHHPRKEKHNEQERLQRQGRSVLMGHFLLHQNAVPIWDTNDCSVMGSRIWWIPWVPGMQQWYAFPGKSGNSLRMALGNGKHSLERSEWLQRSLDCCYDALWWYRCLAWHRDNVIHLKGFDKVSWFKGFYSFFI